MAFRKVRVSEMKEIYGRVGGCLDNKGWRQVASRTGKTVDEIHKLENPTKYDYRFSPGEIVLADWETSSDATVERLLQILKEKDIDNYSARSHIYVWLLMKLGDSSHPLYEEAEQEYWNRYGEPPKEVKAWVAKNSLWEILPFISAEFRKLDQLQYIPVNSLPIDSAKKTALENAIASLSNSAQEEELIKFLEMFNLKEVLSGLASRGVNSLTALLATDIRTLPLSPVQKGNLQRAIEKYKQEYAFQIPANVPKAIGRWAQKYSIVRLLPILLQAGVKKLGDLSLEMLDYIDGLSASDKKTLHEAIQNLLLEQSNLSGFLSIRGLDFFPLTEHVGWFCLDDLKSNPAEIMPKLNAVQQKRFVEVLTVRANQNMDTN